MLLESVKKWLPLFPMWLFCILSCVFILRVYTSTNQTWKIWAGTIGLLIIIIMSIIFTILFIKKKNA